MSNPSLNMATAMLENVGSLRVGNRTDLDAGVIASATAAALLRRGLARRDGNRILPLHTDGEDAPVEDLLPSSVRSTMEFVGDIPEPFVVTLPVYPLSPVAVMDPANTISACPVCRDYGDTPSGLCPECEDAFLSQLEGDWMSEDRDSDDTEDEDYLIHIRGARTRLTSDEAAFTSPYKEKIRYKQTTTARLNTGHDGTATRNRTAWMRRARKARNMQRITGRQRM